MDSNDPAKLSKLIANEQLQRLLVDCSRVSLSVNDPFLYFYNQESGVISDIAQIRSVLNLFKCTFDRLREI